MVGTLGFDEVLVSTYSGWVTGLTTEQKQIRTTTFEDALRNNETPISPTRDPDIENKLSVLR